MGTIAEKLKYALDAKSEITEALRSQGVDVPEGSAFGEYGKLVKSIKPVTTLNIAYGNTPPADTTKLWVKADAKTDQLILADGIDIDPVYTPDNVLPTKKYRMAAAAVENRVYLFGGDSAEGAVSEICVYDTESGTIRLLDATLPVACYNIGAAAVGTNIYLFGGYTGSANLKSIHIFDTVTETITTIDTTLSTANSEMGIAVVGSDIYLFGGDGDRSYVHSFNSESNVLTTKVKSLPTGAIGQFACTVGTKIYVGGGRSYDSSISAWDWTYKVYIFDTTSKTFSTSRLEVWSREYYVALGTKLYAHSGTTLKIYDTETNTTSSTERIIPVSRGKSTIVPCNQKICLFGGWSSGYYPDYVTSFFDDIFIVDLSVSPIGTIEINKGTISRPRLNWCMGAAAVNHKIYLFGGADGTYTTDEIIVFDTIANTLTTLDTKLPYPAYSMGICAIGANIYLFGGASYVEPKTQNTIHVFNAVTNTIRTLDVKMPSTGSAYSVTAANGKIYIFGGSSATDAIYMFDPDNQTIELVANLPEASYGMAVAAVGKYIYIIGGQNTQNMAYRFDLDSNTMDEKEWKITYLQILRKNQAVAVVGSNFYLFGGKSNDDILDRIELFSVESDSLHAKVLDTTLQYPLSTVAAVTVGEKVYLIGGLQYQTASNLINVFDPSDNSLSRVAYLTGSVPDSSMIHVGSKVFCFGGNDMYKAWNGTIKSNLFYDSIFVYDKETNRNTAFNLSLPDSRSRMGLEVVGNRIYIFGGYNGSPLATIYILDLEMNSFIFPGTTFPSGRYGMAVIAVGSKIYIFGGYDGAKALDAIHVFDITNSSLTTLDAKLPVPCYNMGVSVIGNNIYLFGGTDGANTLNSINIFNIATSTITSSVCTLPIATDSMAVGVIDSVCYIFASKVVMIFDAKRNVCYSSVRTLAADLGKADVVFCGREAFLLNAFQGMTVDLSKLLGPHQLVIRPGSNDNVCSLLSARGIELCVGVEAVYTGNNRAKANPVPAFIFKDGAWTEI